MSHAVGTQQQQPLNTTGNSGNTPILNSPQVQVTEPFYGTTTPSQDLNQPPTSVDALTASLSTFAYYNYSICSSCYYLLVLITMYMFN